MGNKKDTLQVKNPTNGPACHCWLRACSSGRDWEQALGGPFGWEQGLGGERLGGPHK
jgi:hypothetical protein